MAERIDKLLASLKDREREVAELKTKLAGAGGGRDILSEAVKIGDTKLLAVKIEIDNPKALRTVSDDLLGKLGSGVLVLGAAAEGKAFLLVRVTQDLTGMFHAGNIIKELAPIVGGGGGGKPDMAQAGGQNPAKLDEAMARAKELVQAQAEAAKA